LPGEGTVTQRVPKIFWEWMGSPENRLIGATYCGSSRSNHKMLCPSSAQSVTWTELSRGFGKIFPPIPLFSLDFHEIPCDP